MTKDNSKGRIFLASERGATDTSWFRSFNTFNFGAYQSKHKSSFGPLYILNDDTLGGGRKFSIASDIDSLLYVIPTVGGVNCSMGGDEAQFVDAGAVLAMEVAKDAVVEFSNPYDDALINFLQIWIRQPADGRRTNMVSFDLGANRNTMVLLTTGEAGLWLGKFDGRAEAELLNPNGMFLFVIQGAFEVQFRLLEARDGLALWDVEKVEIEALSNEAIILALGLDKIN